METSLQLRALQSLSEVPAAAWDALAGEQPFLRHAFLYALEQAGCVDADCGWLPQYLSAWRGQELVGALPLYVKGHSYGEFVFDWAWAEAYERHGLRYYPKLIAAVPFSPIAGARLLATETPVRAALAHAALAAAADFSSLHILFPHEAEARDWEAQGCMLRQGVQFHWKNDGYRSFDDFLQTLAHPKRKKIKQERRRVRDSGVKLFCKRGVDLKERDWDFFYRCYVHTYNAHHSTPYLNADFFKLLGAYMPHNLCMVLAEQEGTPIAAALNLYDSHRLYGRYWGALTYVPALHFEACYYQAIDFCIANGIEWMEGGAQGEHKLSRGFLPVPTWSAHWLRHPEFASAVERFLAREAKGVAGYIDELNERAPFKRKT
ncbi:MAG TPA: GNAT family N-acetyltransferase [Burkholderiales bacterium]|nr:GNAT family N-acetyltransferase [Burkholderiales bacterium]